MRRRERSYANTPGSHVIGYNDMYYQGSRISHVPASYNYVTNRGVYYEQALCLDETHPGPPYRTGGPLLIFQWSDPGCQPIGVGSFSATGGPFSYTYEGGFLPLYKWQNFGIGSSADFAGEFLNPGQTYSANENAWDYGAAGWNRFRPGNPTADLGIFLGEAKDIPRMLKDSARFFHNAWKAIGGTLKNPSKELANHWLSTQFGWLPFLSDLRKFHKTYMSADAQLERIRRNNGRWEKRGGSILDDTVSTVISASTTASGSWPGLASAQYVDPTKLGSHTLSRVTATRAWFEGTFRYYIPNIDSVYWSKRAVMEMYGIFPNPSLLWELTPFSWLVDWWIDVGDVISNMNTGWADNLVARYAYVMKTVEIRGELQSTVNLKCGLQNHYWVFPVTWKTRAGASRFGFGLTDSEFSLRQWSIIGAIGHQHF